jgi:hypothetical protein
MPDPHKDLAPIIEPLAPAVAPHGHNWMVPAGSVAVALVIAGVAIWRWRRNAPMRELSRISRCAAPIDGAHLLAEWMRRHSLQANANWQRDLARLRFGPPAEASAIVFARLCREAHALLKQA